MTNTFTMKTWDETIVSGPENGPRFAHAHATFDYAGIIEGSSTGDSLLYYAGEGYDGGGQTAPGFERIEGSGLDASRAVEVTWTISKAYSGYVHGASPHIMEMYGGNPPRYHVAGLVGTPLYSHHKDDLWNYFYRGICAFGFAAKAFGDEKLFASIREFRDDFAKRSGKADEVSSPPET